MSNQYLFWLHELSAHRSGEVGKKCANLGEIASLGLPAPPGFAISVEGYRHFMTATGAGEEIRAYLEQQEIRDTSGIDELDRASSALRELIHAKALPSDLEDAIRSYYRDLCVTCGAGEARVSVRSAGVSSHPGQYETCLNVVGEDDVIAKVKEVWSSTFNSRSLAARKKQAVSVYSDPIGVAVLKMVNAKSAGVLFTADPNTGDESRMIIEANWGLGESVVGGAVVPDRFVLAKESLRPLERHLGRKERLVAYGDKGVVERATEAGQSGQFCLTDEEAGEIGRLGLVLERHFQCPQDVEWAVDADLAPPHNVVLLQTRREVIAEQKKPIDQILDYMTSFYS
jgi:pyruvate,water dikinase